MLHHAAACGRRAGNARASSLNRQTWVVSNSGVNPAASMAATSSGAGRALSIRTSCVGTSAAIAAAGSAALTALVIACTQPPQVMSGTRNTCIAILLARKT